MSMKRPWRPFRFILKLLLVVFMLFYVVLGTVSFYTLMKRAYVRSLDIHTLTGLIDKTSRAGDTKPVTEWVRLRPLADTDALIDVVTPQSGVLDSLIFLEFSGRMLQLNRPEEALFWNQMAHYRLRFDMIRCKPLNAHEIMDKILRLFPSPQLERLMAAKPEVVEKSVREVLAFDAKYPARNNPAAVCALIDKLNGRTTGLVPQDQWEQHRENLRNATESYLSGQAR